MNNITEIIRKYTAGETTLAQTNQALEDSGSGLRLDPQKHEIRPDEAARFGLLDTGTGTLDKVEVQGGELVGCDCGNMPALLLLGGKRYTVRGRKLEE